MRSFKTILRDLQNKPALCSEGYASSVLEALESDDKSFFLKEGAETELRVEVLSEANTGSPEGNLTALVEIDGGLTYKRQPCTGLQSYQEIKAVMLGLADDSAISTVAMVMNSPGGMAYQCLETARAIRSAFDRTETKLIAYVDGMSCSAGYALTAIADEIISNPMSDVGSIGVVVALRNDMPADIKEGKERIFLTSGKKKRPFDEEGKFEKEFLEKLQAQVDELGEQFITHVATFTELKEDDIRKLEADSFPATKALELGLVDQVMEKDEFMNYLNTIIKDKETEKLTIEANAEQLDALQTQMAEMSTLLSSLQEENKTLKAEKEEAMDVMKKVLEAKEVEAKAELTAEVAGYSFVGENAEAVVEALFAMEDETKTMFSGVLASAQEAIEAKDKEVKEDEAEADMFEATSLKGDGDNAPEAEDAIALAEQFLKKDKGNK